MLPILAVLWIPVPDAFGSETMPSEPPHTNTPDTPDTDTLDRIERVDVPANPFLWLEDVPAAVDAAAVLNNPAEHFLLNDSGRFIRRLFALAGVFTHTEHAWEALSKAFNAETDETIRSLLSRRVVVVWDGIGLSSESIFKFADAIDTQWALVCEVDPLYLQRIRKQLKPVRRRIERGHSVYAIEQGRYEIVLLNPQDNHRGGSGDQPDGWDGAAIILAPRKGSSLLDHVLESYTIGPRFSDNQGSQADQRRGRSIVQGHEELIASVEVGGDWAVAWIAQLDQFLPSQGILSRQIPAEKQSPGRTAVGVISVAQRRVSLGFATNLELELGDDDAPVGLLSAVGGDAIFAAASSQTPSILVERHLFHMISRAKPAADHAPSDTLGFPGGPGLVMLSKASRVPEHTSGSSGQSHPIALTMLTQLDRPGTPDEPVAVRVDRIMHNLFVAHAQSEAPDYQGKFPRAVRTYAIERRPFGGEDNTEKKHSGKTPALGDLVKFSWLAIDGNDPFMILSLAPGDCDTTREIRWIGQAAQSLESIPDQPRVTGVMTRGFFKPAKAIELLDSSSTIDLAISKFITGIEWDIARIPLGVGGTVSIEFSERAGLSTLGQD